MTKRYIRYQFTRQNLFELVWSKPATKIQDELNIPYNELRSVCSKFDIPRPTSSFWGKIANGKKGVVSVLPTNRFPKDEPLSIQILNPEYKAPTKEDDTKRVRDYILAKALREREDRRVDYVLGILQKAKRCDDISDLLSSYKESIDYKALPSVERMIDWTENWLKAERQKISPADINRDLARSDLFDDGEPEFDFDPETWESSLFDMDEFEHLVRLELDDEDAFGVEVVEWGRPDHR